MDIRTYSTTVVSILASKETKELRADLDNARTAAATWKRAAKMLWRCERDAVQMYEREKVERERVEGELMRRIQQLIDANKLNEQLRNELSAMEAHWRNAESLSEQLRAELNAERNAHNATAAQLYAELADARAELDAMRQAHSVIVGRMEAMGC